MKGQKYIIWAVLAALLVAVGVFTSASAADDDSTFRVVNKTKRDIRVEVYAQFAKYGADDGSAKAVFVVPAYGQKDILLDNDETYWYFYEYACAPSQVDGVGVADGQIDMKDDVTITIIPCDSQPTVLQVNNHLPKTISLEFIGYEEKTYEIEPGFNLIKVYSGETIYKYDACDGDFNGVVDILANGRTDFTMHSCEWFNEPARIWGALNPVRFVIVNHASFPVILTLIGPENYLVTMEPGENPVRLVAGTYKYSYYLDYHLTTGSFFVRPNGNGRLLLSPSFTINYEVPDEQQ